MVHFVVTHVAGRNIKLEVGRVARQANGSVLVQCEGTIVMVTVVANRKPANTPFMPLTVEFQEKFYALGKIPGGFFKREGRPTNEAILVARLVDRPIRPLFPPEAWCETQVVVTPLSIDDSVPVEPLCILGASAALHVSDVPFLGPIGAVTVGRWDGKFVINPSDQQREQLDFELVVAGNRKGIVMVEGEARQLTEADLVAALKVAHQHILTLIDAQEELREKTGSVAKVSLPVVRPSPEWIQTVRDLCRPLILSAFEIRTKKARNQALARGLESVTQKVLQEHLLEGWEPAQLTQWVAEAFEEEKAHIARTWALSGKRLDGRALDEVRPITIEVGLLPRAHGSALFTRGETQVLGTVTLGTGDDELLVDSIFDEGFKTFMLHYNFPPFSVGEIGRFGTQGRREIGHGYLAERALKNVIPDHDKFPYTIRVVADVLESNGSSSMGTVCAATLALLDAGVPIKANVSGIAMGLIYEGDQYAILTDILGDEDHLGDMDFKVAGTRDSITAVQMDIKVEGIPLEIVEQALHQARRGRLFILDQMEQVIQQPRAQLSLYAPRFETLKINPDRIRDLIGPGGKVIRAITESTGAKIEVEPDGKVIVFAQDTSSIEKARQMVLEATAEAQVGVVYKGKVVKIAEFGAFVEILPGLQGLLHISELAPYRVRQVTDIVKEGDEIEVKVVEIDRLGRIRLSRKALLS